MSLEKVAPDEVYRAEIIQFFDALEKRNLLAHTYGEKRAIEAENLIRKSYFGILQQLEIYLNAKQ